MKMEKKSVDVNLVFRSESTFNYTMELLIPKNF